MRVNVYAEEMTDRVEIVSKRIDGVTYTGVRFYLYLPVTVHHGRLSGDDSSQEVASSQVSGPFLHREGDDDSSAVTFWGKGKLAVLLRRALTLLGEESKGGK